jgi:hypothetical protein
MSTHPLRHRPDRTTAGGFILVTVALMVLVIGGVSYGFLFNALADRTALQTTQDTLLALEIAEMGLVRSEMELRSETDPDGDGVGTVRGTHAGGTYAVVASAYPGDNDRFTLTASSTHGHAARRLEVGLRRVRATRFKMALFGEDDVVASGGSASDAYDSRLGTYASQATNSDANGSFAQDKGDVGSNGTITLTGVTTVVRGDAIPGPDGSVNGGGTVTGSTDPRPTRETIARVPYEEFVAALLENDNDQLLGESWYDPATLSVSIQGRTSVSFPPGTYFFTDMTFGTQVDVVITGPTKIYATGELSLTSHSMVNEGGVPADFQILQQPYALPPGFESTSRALKLTAHSDLVMAVFAPDQEVQVTGHGEIFGALVGRSIKFAGQGNLHYDIALGDIGGNKVVATRRLYWRDLAPPQR